MVQDRIKLTVTDWEKVIYDLSNSAIFNDLEMAWMIHNSDLKERNYSMLNVSDMVQFRNIVTMDNYEYRMVLFPMTLSGPSRSQHSSMSYDYKNGAR